MRNFILLSLIAVILSSCSAGKKTTGDDLTNAPEWVRKTPPDPLSYQGIGSAPKNSQMDYREKAKQNALSDMAGNISVDISTSSVLSQYETDQKVSDYYRDNIKTSTKNYLEGYEMVDSWESKDRYWVYFRLSKAEYERIKQQRIRTAVSNSEGEYSRFSPSIQSGNYAEAIKSVIKGIEKVKDFLGEDLKSDLAGVNQSYPGKLMADLTTALQEIRIVYPEKNIEVSNGQKIPRDNLEAAVENENGKRLVNIPVNTTYSWAPGKKSELFSDASGILRIKPGMISSRKRTEYISSTVNLDKIVREATSDPFIRKLLAGIKLTEFVLPVNLTPSVFSVTVIENPAIAHENHLRLDQELTSVLSKDGYTVVKIPEQAGFRLSVSCSTQKTSERNGKTAVSLTAEVIVKDKSGNKLFQQTVGDLSGLGNSMDEAITDAFNGLYSKLKISVFPAIYRQIFL